jgi:hypothetical protein
LPDNRRTRKLHARRNLLRQTQRFRIRLAISDVFEQAVAADAAAHLDRRALRHVPRQALDPAFTDVLNVANALTLSNAAVSFNIVNSSATQPSYVFAKYGSLTGNPFISFTGIPDGYTINYNYQNLKEIALVPSTVQLKLGDFNFDGHVNGADVTAMMAALTNLTAFKAANTLTDARLLTIGDLDSSGAFDNADLQGLLTLLKNGGGSVAPVPEPPTVVLAGLGVLGATLVRRRARQPR